MNAVEVYFVVRPGSAVAVFRSVHITYDRMKSRFVEYFF